MKRFLRWSLIVAAGLLVVYLIAFALLSMQPYVNDSDLRARREPVSDAENAFRTLEKAAELIWWPDEENLALSDLAQNTNWNSALATKALANNRETLRLLDTAMKLPAVQVPEYRMQDALPYLAGWKRLAQVACIRANVSFNAGREVEAFQEALGLVRFGRQLQACQGGQIHYQVGSAVKSLGIQRIRDWAGRSRLSPPQLATVIRELDNVPDDSEPLVETLKVEYQVVTTALLDIRQGRMVVQEDGTLKRYVPIKFLPVYNHNKTRRLFASATRTLILCVDVPYSEGKRPDFDHRPGPAKLILGGNVAGETAFWLHMPMVDKLIAYRCQEDVAMQTTRLLLAMRAYQLKLGRLPGSLEALTPEFVPSVPEDAFNSAPLMYSPEFKVIYSVGENLRDDGGSIGREEGKRQRLDYGCAVNFKN
jgi:hypothetical protein